MRKLFTFLLACFCCAGAAWADDGVTYLVTDTDDYVPLSKIFYLVEGDQDDIHFDIVTFGLGTFQNVSKVTVARQSPVGIQAIGIDTNVRYTHATSTLTLTAPAGHTLTLVDASGRAVRSILTVQGSTTVNLADLTPGLYILAGDNVSYKFIKD